jgi:hypothetical protein
MTIKSVRMCDMNNDQCNHAAIGDPCKICGRDFCGYMDHSVQVFELVIDPRITDCLGRSSDSLKRFSFQIRICSECVGSVSQATDAVSAILTTSINTFVGEYVKAIKVAVAALLLEKKK